MCRNREWRGGIRAACVEVYVYDRGGVCGGKSTDKSGGKRGSQRGRKRGRKSAKKRAGKRKSKSGSKRASKNVKRAGHLLRCFDGLLRCDAVTPARRRVPALLSVGG